MSSKAVRTFYNYTNRFVYTAHTFPVEVSTFFSLQNSSRLLGPMLSQHCCKPVQLAIIKNRASLHLSLVKLLLRSSKRVNQPWDCDDRGELDFDGNVPPLPFAHAVLGNAVVRPAIVLAHGRDGQDVSTVLGSPSRKHGIVLTAPRHLKEEE